ncbi:hypothetical protein [Streptomyces sp. NPDC051214]|uniref:hypothetical protein n=1 Tax=Streptomyces sp. NPDC051214 TaxID=3155282 RepID=UPI003419C2DA
MPERLVLLTVVLLPADGRDRYAEEWLADLAFCEDAATRWQLALSNLRGAFRLRWTLSRGASRRAEPAPTFDIPAVTPGTVIGGTLPRWRKHLLRYMSPRRRARYLLRRRLKDEAATGILLEQLSALRHQTAMSIIDNIR